MSRENNHSTDELAAEIIAAVSTGYGTLTEQLVSQMLTDWGCAADKEAVDEVLAAAEELQSEENPLT